MIRTLARLSIVMLVGLGTAAGAGAIPDASAQSRADIQAARDKFREGKEHYQAERYLEAAEAFKVAYELSGRAELLYNVGQSYRLAGRFSDAEQYLQRYLTEAPDADNSQEVVQAIVEIQLAIAARLATVMIETTVAGRDVLVDAESEPRCQTPCSITVQPGAHTITLKGEGAQDLVEAIELEPGKTLQLKTELPPSITPGRLVVYSDEPGSRVRIGEEQEQVLPLKQPLELPPGDYPVEIAATRNTRWMGRVTVEPEETTQLVVPMQSLVEARKRGGLRRSLAYGLWGVSAASGVAGVLMGMQARSTYEQLVTQRARQGFVDDALRTQGGRQQMTANVMFGLTAVAVVGGIALFVWDEFSQ